MCALVPFYGILCAEADCFEAATSMSALGHKQTYAVQNAMSALPPKADMCGALGHVCFGPKADICSKRKTASRRFCHEFSKRTSIDNEKSISGVRNKPVPRPA